jgi:hypothetical protein
VGRYSERVKGQGRIGCAWVSAPESRGCCHLAVWAGCTRVGFGWRARGRSASIYYCWAFTAAVAAVALLNPELGSSSDACCMRRAGSVRARRACGPRGADAHARGTSSALNVAPSSHPVCLAIQCFAPPAVPRIEQSASLMTESDASPTSFLRPLLYMHVRVV